MPDLSHFDESGASRMVDVGSKPVSHRVARASGVVRMRPATLRRIQEDDLKKGNVLEVARLAAIMAAKRTSDLIPLCHLLPLTAVRIDFQFRNETTVRVEATVETVSQTGVEMEALTAVSIAALTIYDMCKAIDREIVLEEIRLDEKSGGSSGHFVRSDTS